MTPASLRLLIVHESYANRGGEDQAVEADVPYLERSGHRVRLWSESNLEIQRWPAAKRAALLWRTTWSRSSYRRLRAIIGEERPDVVHFHNTLPILSPSAIWSAHDAGLPVVLTLHNFRLLCPVGTFLRDGRVCEDCRVHSLARGVLHGCYRGSRVQTAAVAAMLGVHRRAGTWSRRVDAYIAQTEFMRSKMTQGLLPGEKVHVRANLVEIPEGMRRRPQGYALFVGRLSPEKGIAPLIEAARMFGDLPLKVVGGGGLEPSVRSAAEGSRPPIELLGSRPHRETLEILAGATVVVIPSLCYEGLGLVALEALALGIPIVATGLGGLAEIITDGVDGFLVPPGDSIQIADRVRRIAGDPLLRESMSAAGRRAFELRYAPQESYSRLMAIYRTAIESARARRSAA